MEEHYQCFEFSKLELSEQSAGLYFTHKGNETKKVK